MKITETRPPEDVCELMRATFGPNVLIDQRDCTYFMFYNEDDRCVACSGIYKHSDTWYRLHTDCVHPDYRRMGIGTCMYMVRIEYIKRVLGNFDIDLLIEHHKLGSKLMGSVLRKNMFQFVPYSVNTKYTTYKLDPDPQPTDRELYNVSLCDEANLQAYRVYTDTETPTPSGTAWSW